MRQELESKLLFASPAELLLAEPASTETQRLLAHIGEQLGGVAPRLESAEGGRFRREGAALEAVEAFYSGGSGSSGGGASPAAAAAAGSASAAAASTPAAPVAALDAVRRLPPLMLRALAHLLEHLRPFGLEAVLRLGATFQQWDTAAEMRLSANTLRWVGCGGAGGGGRGRAVQVGRWMSGRASQDFGTWSRGHPAAEHGPLKLACHPLHSTLPSPPAASWRSSRTAATAARRAA